MRWGHADGDSVPRGGSYPPQLTLLSRLPQNRVFRGEAREA